MSSPKERHECPRCGQPIAADAKSCSHCGLELKKKGVFPTGCIIALLFLVGYPVLALGTCFGLYFGAYTSGGSNATPDALFPTAVLIAPALVMVVIAWLVIRKRGSR